jgi:hypothetical protein
MQGNASEAAEELHRLRLQLAETDRVRGESPKKGWKKTPHIVLAF